MRCQSAAPRSPVLLKDPIQKRFYRFSFVQGAVLRRMDGTQSAEAIAFGASQECETVVEPAQVVEFASNLRDLSLLDHPACWAKLEEATPRPHRLRSVLSIKVRAFDPDRILTRIERRTRFLFSTAFVVVAALVLFAAACVTVLNWESLSGSLGGLLDAYSIPLILVAGLGVSSLHEMGHGLTLKHFGGRVEEMGFLLLYFMPAFYCDVSDAWMLPRRQRYAVTLAGGFVQLLVWAIATLAWRLLAPEVFLSRVCVVVIAFSGVQTLFNFNPLIRLDGYYLLSDYLNVPNLRRKAFGLLAHRLRRWLGEPAPGDLHPAPTRREEKILWRYGLCSIAFSAALAWVGITQVAGWLVDRFQMWGIAAVSAVCLLSVQMAGKDAATTAGVLGLTMRKLRKTPLSLLALGVVAAIPSVPTIVRQLPPLELL